MTRFFLTISLLAALASIAFALVTASPSLRRHVPGDAHGVHANLPPRDDVADHNVVSLLSNHLRHDEAALAPPHHSSRKLARFIPNDYSEFAHLAEFISVSIGSANAAAEEKAKKAAEEVERARANGLVYSTDSSSVEEREAEARRKALRAYGIDASGSAASGSQDFSVETTAPAKQAAPAEQKKALLASIGW